LIAAPMVRGQAPAAPVRLAVLAEDAAAAVAADLILASFADHQEIHLLERTEIDKAWRELALSASGKDSLKLGRMLGADGLLALTVSQSPAATNLCLRLMAVKPGVLLADRSFSWPLPEPDTWAKALAGQFSDYAPKLKVLARDAIPLSVVNLRSAIQSDAEKEVERQLKLLALQRLSREPRIFVLERERLQMLGEEQEQSGDEAAFWNGSYLLEGVIDQDGYSKDALTINARLVPPHGAPVALPQIRESRDKLPEAVSRLAEHVTSQLRLQSAVSDWSPMDEAVQYQKEADWALRWEQYGQALAAADSAWALGKHDRACAQARLMALVKLAGEGLRPRRRVSAGSLTNLQEVISNLDLPRRRFQEMMAQLRSQRTNGSRHFLPFTNQVAYAGVQAGSAQPLPEPSVIRFSSRALELYAEFSRAQGGALLEAAGSWRGPDWTRLGIQSLETASQILARFQAGLGLQADQRDQLAHLRAAAREASGWLAAQPMVVTNYYIEDTPAADIRPLGPRTVPSIIACIAEQGGLWQETAEDGFALYRRLMDSPLFCLMPREFWSARRTWPSAHLACWDGRSESQLRTLWSNKLSAFAASTNLVLSLNAQALLCVDKYDEASLPAAFRALLDRLLTHREALMSGSLRTLSLCWSPADFSSALLEGGDWGARTAIESDLKARYAARWEELRQESLFREQRRFLKSGQPYEFREFVELFRPDGRTPAQASELLALLRSYESNHLAAGLNPRQSRFAWNSEVDSMEFFVGRKLQAQAAPVERAAERKVASSSAPPAPPLTNTLEVPASCLLIDHYVSIPMPGAAAGKTPRALINTHRWTEGRLLVDLEYLATKSTNYRHLSPSDVSRAYAVLDPEKEHWQVMPRRGSRVTQPRFTDNCAVLWQGSLFYCEQQALYRQALDGSYPEPITACPDGDYRLFNIRDHLYAANPEFVCQILEGGKSVRILASTRRRPPVTILDSQDSLEAPFLRQGSNGEVSLLTPNQSYTFGGRDWLPGCSMPPGNLTECADGTILIRNQKRWNREEDAVIRAISAGSSQPEVLLLQQVARRGPVNLPGTFRAPPRPRWRVPSSLALEDVQAAVFQGELWLYDVRSGNEAELYCFSRDSRTSLRWPLRFDASAGHPPATRLDSGLGSASVPPVRGWFLVTSNCALFGLESPSVWSPRSQEDHTPPGVWVLPLTNFAADVLVRREAAARKKEEAAIRRARLWSEMLARYDRDQNGEIEGAEKGEALANPAYIEVVLDRIDRNQNSVLDLDELGFFDANTNGILDPNELAGIVIARDLLAARVFERFDANHDGVLDEEEMEDLNGPSPVTARREVARRESRADFMTGAARMLLMRLRAYRFDPQLAPGSIISVTNFSSALKPAVEFYWRDPAAVTDAPMFPRSDGAPVTNRLRAYRQENPRSQSPN
jgi:hypothetical protein